MLLYNKDGLPICNRCKKHTKNLSLEPSRRQLIFGGFPIEIEYRCQKCEKEVSSLIQKLIEEKAI